MKKVTIATGLKVLAASILAVGLVITGAMGSPREFMELEIGQSTLPCPPDRSNATCTGLSIVSCDTCLTYSGYFSKYCTGMPFKLYFCEFPDEGGGDCVYDYADCGTQVMCEDASPQCTVNCINYPDNICDLCTCD
jgi:hypothetical protein